MQPNHLQSADQHSNNDFRPRVIMWQLTNSAVSEEEQQPWLSSHESLLIIDSIASVSKSILILTGPKLLSSRTDLFDIVSYGAALGLKMILEVEPEELNDEVLEKFRGFGPRVFRIILDGRVLEDMNTRFRQTPEFQHLEHVVDTMKRAGYEIHFSLNIKKPNQRRLSYNLDYAFRRAAKGLYCHFHLVNRKVTDEQRENFENSLDGFIERISELKSLVPSDMYCSPQCIKYVSYIAAEEADDILPVPAEDQPKWVNMCLAGKTFSFINEFGKVYVCSAMHVEGGDLRENRLDFKKIWLSSTVFNQLRDHRWSCIQTRAHLTGNKVPSNGKAKDHVSTGEGTEGFSDVAEQSNSEGE